MHHLRGIFLIIKFSKALHNLVLSLFLLLFIGFSGVFSATTTPNNLIVQGLPSNNAVTINADGTNVYFQAVYNSDTGQAQAYRVTITTQNQLGSVDYSYWSTIAIKDYAGGTLQNGELSQKIYYGSTDHSIGNWFPLQWRVTYNWGISFQDANGDWSPTANSFFRVFDNNRPSINVKVPTADLNAWHNVSKDWMSAITVNFSHPGISKLDRGEYSYGGVITQIIGLSDQTNVTKQLAVSFSVLTAGINCITINVSDNAGNLVTTTFNINKDISLPTIDVSSDLASNNYFTNWITQDTNFYETISVSFYDQGAGLKDISVVLLNENGNFSKIISLNVASHSYVSPWGVSWNQIPQGLSQLVVSLSDYAGNTNNVTPLQLRKDQIPPRISRYLPTASYENRWFSDTIGYQPYQSDGVSIINLSGLNIDFVDTQSYIERVQYSISNNNSIIASGIVVSGAASSNYTANWPILFSSFNNGYNEVFVSFNDRAGLSSSNVKVFYLQKDIITPQLAWVASPSNVAYFNQWYRATPSALATINFTASDNAYSKLYRVGYYVKDDLGNEVLAPKYLSENMSAPSYNFRLSNIPSSDYMMQGTNNLWIRVEDNAGNLVSQSIFSFQRDIQAPILNGVSSVKNTIVRSMVSG